MASNPLVDLATVYRFQVKGSVDDQNFIMTQHFAPADQDGGGISQTFETALTKLRDNWRTAFKPLMPDSLVINRFELRGIVDHVALVVGPPIVPAKLVLSAFQYLEGVTGTDEGARTQTSDELYPLHDCIVISGVTGDPGRGSGTYWKIGPIFEDDAADGELTDSSSGLTAFQNIATQLAATVTIQAAELLFVPVKFQEADFLASAPATNPVDYASAFLRHDVNPRIRTCRSRRKPLRGQY